MLKIKRSLKVLLCFVFAIILSCFTASNLVYADEREVYLGGFPAGFILNTTTVQVVGVCDVLTQDGMKCPARECGIKTGDIIEKINNIEINCTNDVNVAVSEDFKNVKIQVLRNEQTIEVETSAVTEITSGKKRLGLLIKDNLNGIGTVTYIDKSAGVFGALGHPVTDEKNNLQKINGGSVYGCKIYEVKRGVRGTPGELRGIFENDNMIGNAVLNCKAGVFGKISKEINTENLIKIKTASIDEVQMGKASVYSTVGGNGVEEFEVSIVKIDKDGNGNRSFVIKIDDPNLIIKTGGIVQGMSGSPIVQNGKLIGAVTHVFVNDPTRGYGISIDKMLSSY